MYNHQRKINSEPVSNLWWFNFPEMVTHSDTDTMRKCSTAWCLQCQERNVVRWPVTSPGVSSVVTMARAGAGQIVRWLHCQTHIWKHTVIFVEKIAASGVSSPHRLFLALSNILNLQSCTVYHWVTQPSAVTYPGSLSCIQMSLSDNLSWGP